MWENILTEPIAALAMPGVNAADAAVNNIIHATDKTTRRIIRTTLERKPSELLFSCTIAREKWVKFNSVYNLKSDENTELVQKQFFDFK